MYIKKKDLEMLTEICNYLYSIADFNRAYELDTFISHAEYDAQKQSLKAVDSMRRYREKNPEKAKEYQREYMRRYNNRKRREKLYGK